MDLFGEKIGYYNRYNTGLLKKNRIDKRGIETIDYINYPPNERAAFKTNSELYARELIKRNGISDQNEIYRNRIYDKFSRDSDRKTDYFNRKNVKLNKYIEKLRNVFKNAYLKALKEGYSQSAAENIAQKKTDKKKKELMSKLNQRFPF